MATLFLHLRDCVRKEFTGCCDRPADVRGRKQLDLRFATVSQRRSTSTTSLVRVQYRPVPSGENNSPSQLGAGKLLNMRAFLTQRPNCRHRLWLRPKSPFSPSQRRISAEPRAALLSAPPEASPAWVPSAGSSGATRSCAPKYRRSRSGPGLSSRGS